MRILISVFLFIIFTVSSVYGDVSVKIRDIAVVDGVRENQLFGFGIVVGLQGSGDSRNFSITNESIKNLMKNLGLEGDDYRSQNSAAVMVTATLPPFARAGDNIDVTVSSIGDARSLEGGVLVQSILRGADNRGYVAAQGQVTVPKSPGNARGVNTVGRIVNGGIVEQELAPGIMVDNTISLTLNRFNFSLANSVINVIKDNFPESDPVLADTGNIRVTVDNEMSMVEFISEIENLEVVPSSKSVVVIFERDATIASGGSVKISEAMVSREGITVEIGEGREGSAHHIESGATVKDLVDAMNATGASTIDIIVILKALKESGALHAELIVR